MMGESRGTVMSPLPTPAGLTPWMIPPHMEHALLTFKRCYIRGLPPLLPIPAGLTPYKLMIPPHMEYALLTFKCYIRGLPPLHKQITSSR